MIVLKHMISRSFYCLILTSRLSLPPSLPSFSHPQYAPRIKNARNFLATEFKAALDKKDWAAVAAAYEIKAQAPDSSMRADPQRFTNNFER